MKISIIIPVFNAEKYLKKCLNSVLIALGDIDGEILLVNDNSTDGSLKIIDEYEEKNPEKIRVLKSKARGASAARNAGAMKAKGEYIWFIDADDYIAKEAIRQLIAKADSAKADLVMVGAERVYLDGHRDYLSAVDESKPDYKSRFVRYGMGPWQVLIRKKWWFQNDFSFHEGIIHEDMELMSALILHTDNFASVDKPLYFYRQTQNSVLHRSSWNEHANDIFPALEGLYERFKAAKAEKRYHDELEWFFIWNLLIDSAKDFGQFPEGKASFKRSREMLSSYFPGWRKNRFLKQKPLKLQIRVRLNYFK